VPVRLRLHPLTHVFLAAADATGCTPFAPDITQDAEIATTDAGTNTPSSDGAADTDDSGGSNEREASACHAYDVFGQPRFVPGFTTIMNTWVIGLRLSSDQLTGYYSTNPPDGMGYSDLYVASRSSANMPFGYFAPIAGAGFNTVDYELNPTVSGDGLTIVFERRKVGRSSSGLYFGTRADTSAPFTYAGALGVTANGNNDASPFLLADGKALYFSGDPGPLAFSGIYRTTQQDDGGFGEPVRLDGLDMGSDLFAPVVTPDDQTLYFGSGSRAEEGGTASELWVATRASPDAPFSEARVVQELNATGRQNFPTYVSPDGCTLYFDKVHDDEVNPFGVFEEYLADKLAE
jgi:hypothetical protein